MMKPTFKRRLWKTIAIILSGFALLFAFRMIYGYSTDNTGNYDSNYIGSYFSDVENKTRNIATEKIAYDKSGGAQAMKEAPAESTQEPAAPATSEGVVKYEKTATLNARSTNFDADEKRLRDVISNYKAVIQYEQNEGKKGNRELHMQLGIAPEKFDSFANAIKRIGKLRGIQITKVDRTNEYHELNAKKTSLEKIRISLIDLKTKSGKIDEHINLDNRILEIEEQLQELGVSLGDFDSESQFCTVECSLVEGQYITTVSFLHRCKTAFEWTVMYYAGFLVVVALSAFSAFFILLIIDKLKLLNMIMKNLRE